MLWIDCTLRDGGYYNSWDFPKELVETYLQAMQDVGVDYVELGFRSLKKEGFKGAYAFTTDSHIKELALPEGLKIGVMVNASELLGELSVEPSLEKLFPVAAKDSPVTLVRIACHVHEFEASLPASLWLKQRGYEVGFNLMQIADRSEKEVIELASKASEYPLDVLYFADSMGSMKPAQTIEIVGWIRSAWSGAVGIHTHDNMGLALTNTLAALDNGVTWIDSTVTGMGRGPGNAKTEELVIEVAERRNASVNLIPLMRVLKQHFKPMQQRYGWGTNPYYYLAGKYGIHPTYIQEMINDSRYDEEDILAAIQHLKIEGGKKFSFDTLDASRYFYQGELKGGWEPAEMLAGQEVLLLGGGPSVVEHRKAIEAYILRNKPIVIAMNTMASIDESLINLRVACHPVRLLSDCEAHCGLPQALITPFSMLPVDVRKALEGKDILDYGLAIEPDKFDFSDRYCTIPSPLVLGYVLAIAASGKAERVLMAGFDGYGADDPRSHEVQKVIALYLSVTGCASLVSVTPTRYSIPTQSIYAL